MNESQMRAWAGGIASIVAVSVDTAVAKAADQFERRMPITGGRVERGISVARIAKAMVLARATERTVSDVLKGWGYEELAKSLTTASFTQGGSLVHQQYLDTFIESARAAVVVRQAGPQLIDLKTGGPTVVDRDDGEATAVYAVTDTDDLETNGSRTSQLVFIARKLFAFVNFPMDIIRNTGPRAEEFTASSLRRAIAERENRSLLVGTGLMGEPLGLFKQVASAHRLTMTALAAAGTPTVAEVRAEIARMRKALRLAKIPMERLALFLGPCAEEAIRSAVDESGGNSLDLEMSVARTVCGIPFFVSTQIPEETTSEMLMVDASEVLLGDATDNELTVFPNAIFKTNGQIVSGISADRAAVRTINKHDIHLKRDTSGVVVTGLTWGI